MGVSNKPETVVDMDSQAAVDPDTPIVTWNTRRRIAVISTWSIIVCTAVLIWLVTFHSTAPENDKLQTLETIYTYFLGFMCSVVLGYFGSTTLPYIGKGIFGGKPN